MVAAKIFKPVVRIVRTVIGCSNHSSERFIDTRNHTQPRDRSKIVAAFANNDCVARPVSDITESNLAVAEENSVALERIVFDFDASRPSTSAKLPVAEHS